MEMPSWVEGALGLLGAGGGYRLITHEHRIKTLEKQAQDAIDVSREVSEMRGTLEAVHEGVEEIRAWIMGRAK